MIKMRSKLFRLYCFLLLLVSSSNIASVDVKEIAVNESMNVLNSFMDTFNSRDMQSWSQTLNYPHVRIAGGKVTVWNTQEEYAAEDIFERLASTGWHRSEWLSREVILVSEDKVHISTVFQRYDKDNKPMKKYQSLYIVTKQNGEWGVQARSSLAP
jgi:Fe-S cluster biosynthesis and repair protein YggX